MLQIFSELIRMALSSIRSQPLRTWLTVGIIGIGIWALVGIFGAIHAIQHSLLESFSSMGANTISVNRWSSDSRVVSSVQRINPIINYQEAARFKEEFPIESALTSISFQASSMAEVSYESTKTEPSIGVVGVDEHYLINSGSEVSIGRNFSSRDIESNQPVCIIGSDLAKLLFKETEPLGKEIKLKGLKVTVIGVLESKGSSFFGSSDNYLLLPIQLSRSLYSRKNVNYDISTFIPDSFMMEEALDAAKFTMRSIRNLTPSDEDNFGIRKSDEFLRILNENTQTLRIAGTAISIITILGSSIALMNIMLVSVSERTREIGIRKSLGAKRRHIFQQFFIETLTISQLGCALGILLGLLTTFAFSKAMGFEMSIPWGIILIAIGIAVLTALIAGLYPANKASALDPVESLRHE